MGFHVTHFGWSAGETAPGEVPQVLKDEIQRMCEELGDPRLGQTAPWVKADGSVGGRRWWTGCHVSTSGGMERAVINAASIGQCLPVSNCKYFRHLQPVVQTPARLLLISQYSVLLNTGCRLYHK